jgi:hypothetical protein
LEEKNNQQPTPNFQNAVAWFRDSIRGLNKTKIGKPVDYLEIIHDKDKTAKKRLVGQVLLFQYRPKTKVKFYDRFPLVIVLEFNGRNMLGLNLHYVPPQDRIKLILLMNSVLFNKNERDFQKVRVRVLSLLNKQIFAKYLGTAVNYYTASSIIGKPKITTPEEWSRFAFLPVFKGINPTNLYSQIRQRIKNVQL